MNNSSLDLLIDYKKRRKPVVCMRQTRSNNKSIWTKTDLLTSGVRHAIRGLAKNPWFTVGKQSMFIFMKGRVWVTVILQKIGGW